MADLRILVIGDVLLDRDVEGRVARVAPDAPVPVVDVERVVVRPGGAALAAALLARPGIEVWLAAATADDAAGRRLLGGLVGRVRLVPTLTVPATRTVNRIRSAGQSLLRVDEPAAGLDPGTPMDPKPLWTAIAAADAVLVADYGAGVTGHLLVREAIAHRPPGTPVVWDPHPRGHGPVAGCTVVTPNLAEAQLLAATAGPVPAGRRDCAPDRTAAVLRELWQVPAVAVTAGSTGVFCALAGSPPLFVPTPLQCPGDPVGAGDRFAGSTAAALAAGAVISEAVGAAVHDVAAWLCSGGVAGAAFGRPGSTAAHPAPAAGHAGPATGHDAEGTGLARAVRLAERVRAAGGTVVATGGCFELLHAGHVESLQAARRLGDCLVVLLNSDRSIRRIKGPDRPVNREQDRRRVLEALDCVDVVALFDDDTPIRALQELRPQVWAKGGDYASASLPEADLLPEWGGRVVVLPYLDGRSTTTILDRLKESRR